MFDFGIYEVVGVLELVRYWEGHYAKGPPPRASSNALLAGALAGIEPSIPAEDVEQHQGLMRLIRGTCTRLESEAGLDRIQRIEDAHKYPALLKYSDAHHHWQALREAIEGDLKKRYFQYVPRLRAEMVLEIDNTWRTATEKFTETADDISGAVECYALGQPTACVFHLMRAMEVVVRKLGRRFNITITPQTTWVVLTGNMADKIKVWPEKTDRQKQKKDAWQGSIINLHHVGRAWRNSTMHPARSYTSEQARHVLDATRVFMSDLSVLLGAR